MRNASTLVVGIVAAAALGLAGCDVEKTKEGNVTVPKYEVQKTQEGNVSVPEYKVTTPDVNVGTKQAEVPVPKVTTEKETVTVPSVDIKTADEKKKEEGRK